MNQQIRKRLSRLESEIAPADQPTAAQREAFHDAAVAHRAELVRLGGDAEPNGSRADAVARALRMDRKGLLIFLRNRVLPAGYPATVEEFGRWLTCEMPPWLAPEAAANSHMGGRA